MNFNSHQYYPNLNKKKKKILPTYIPRKLEKNLIENIFTHRTYQGKIQFKIKLKDSNETIWEEQIRLPEGKVIAEYIYGHKIKESEIKEIEEKNERTCVKIAKIKKETYEKKKLENKIKFIDVHEFKGRILYEYEDKNGNKNTLTNEEAKNLYPNELILFLESKSSIK